MDHVRDGNQHLHHKYTKNIVMLFIFNELFYIELTLKLLKAYFRAEHPFLTSILFQKKYHHENNKQT